MRIVIAGWQGQIAQSLLEVIAARNDVEACALGRPALDICEVRSIERAFVSIKPHVIINAAAYTDVDKAESEPDRAFALNRDGARQLASVAAGRGVPIIHISTDYVFDGLKRNPYTEADDPNPQSVYGRSKLSGEEAVASENAQHIILRTAWVFSPFGRNFVKSILERAREGQSLRVVNDAQGSPTYAIHFATAVMDVAARIASSQPIKWGTYHAAGAGAASWYDVARETLKSNRSHELGVADLQPIASASYATKAARPSYCVLDCAKLSREFGLALPEWQSGVSDCCRRLSTLTSYAE